MRNPSQPVLRALFGVVLCAACGGLSVPVWGQSADDLQLRLRPGLIRQSDGQTVMVRDENGHLVVGKVHVQVGDQVLVMLPTGRLRVVSNNEMQPTKLEFRSATKQKIVDGITENPIFKNFRTAQSDRHVYVYDCDKSFVRKVSEILETVHKGVYRHFKNLGFDVHPAEYPMAVIVFPTQEEFQKYSDMTGDVGAYYNTMSNHVILYQESKLSSEAPKLAYQQTLGSVAHEGVHQTLHNIGVQQRLSRWPMWLSEGLPEYFAPTTKDDSVDWKGVGEVNDIRMLQLAGYLQSDEADSAGVVVELTKQHRLSAAGYASAWGLTHYLAVEHPDRFWRYVRHISQREPMENGLMTLSALEGLKDYREFVRYIGINPAQLERGMVTHLRRQKFKDPSADDRHFLVMLQYTDGPRRRRVAGLTLTRSGVDYWKSKLLGDLSPNETKTASIRVLKFENRNHAVKYAGKWLEGDGQLVVFPH